MIKNNELRIGNWIYIGELIGQVNTDSFKTTEMFDPIPLTAEVLEKCGFVDDTDEIVYKSYRNNEIAIEYYKKDSNAKLVFYEANDDYGTSLPSVPILYLHQLQNITFVLTGTELIVNI